MSDNRINNDEDLLSQIDKIVEKWTWERYQRIQKDLLPLIDKSVEKWTWERYKRIRGKHMSYDIILDDLKEELQNMVMCAAGGSSTQREEFDAIIPIGPACRPAHQLKLHNLRMAAFPLDWQMDYSLDTVAHLLETEFFDFFQEVAEDEERTKNLNPGLQKNRHVTDVKNKIVSIHHFPKKLSLEEGQREFHKVMMPRAKRLIDVLKKSKRVLFVCNRSENSEKLGEFLEEVHKIYPHGDFTLINMRDNSDMEDGEPMNIQEMDKEYAHIRDYTFNDTNEIGGISDYWKGSIKKWHEVLKHIALKGCME
ncbi:DUF1796 family putative cysteine peptidase [Selenomonas sp. KH1T6]|uniref:DUF1796 family putative cysteine peptidase n=1 Tax=Selenomonas sp. KH1T6 TaxID=3158784 RepID=UPI0008A76C43|nr:Putative papain-like cysteine peptidase [Selenomonas ruminantium]